MARRFQWGLDAVVEMVGAAESICQRPRSHGLLKAFATTSATANPFPYKPQSEGAGDQMDDKGYETEHRGC